MKILLPVHIFFPDHRAGVEAYTLQLARGLAKQHEVLVLTTEKVISRTTGTIRDYSLGGLSVRAVVNNLCYSSFEESWSSTAMEEAYLATLAEFEPDLVHAQHLMYWSLAVADRTRALGIPFLLTLHDYYLACGRLGQLVDAAGDMCEGPAADRCAPCLARTTWRQPPAAEKWIRRLTTIREVSGLALDEPMRRLERWTRSLSGKKKDTRPSETPPALPADELESWKGRHAAREEAFRSLAASIDLIVTPSETLRQFMVSWGVDSKRTRRVPQGLDPAPFVGASPKAVGRPLRLAFLGTIAPHKGVHVLLEAAARLPEGMIEVLVHGPSSQHADYAEGLREKYREVSFIRFAGLLTREQIPSAYESIDLLCVPSLWNECCPLTIQEAFMAKVPCLVTGMGGMAELVRDGVDGRHLRPGDVDHWETVIRELAASPESVEAMAEAVPRVPSVNEHLETLESIYSEFLGG